MNTNNTKQDETKARHMSKEWLISELRIRGYREGSQGMPNGTEGILDFNELEDILTISKEHQIILYADIIERMCDMDEWDELTWFFNTKHARPYPLANGLISQDAYYNTFAEYAIALKLIRYGQVKVIYDEDDVKLNDERNPWDVILKSRQAREGQETIRPFMVYRANKAYLMLAGQKAYDEEKSVNKFVTYDEDGGTLTLSKSFMNIIISRGRFLSAGKYMKVEKTKAK